MHTACCLRPLRALPGSLHRPLPNLLFWLATLLPSAICAANDGNIELERWLVAQQAVSSWRAEVRQTRTLKALATPLVTTGTVVFARPGNVRWQLGDPPRTIAIGSPDGFTVAYPRLQQVERYPFGETMSPAVQPVTDLLQLGFPEDTAAFHDRYELVAADIGPTTWRFRLLPRSPEARQLLAAVWLVVDAAGLGLQATEFEFTDGSTMNNAFSGRESDPDLRPDTFELTIDPSWQVVEPM